MDLDASKEVIAKSLQLTFEGLPTPPTEILEGQCIQNFKVNRTLIGSRVAHLQKRFIIIYLLDYNPTRDVTNN